MRISRDFIVKRDDSTLSMKVLVELLRAVTEKGYPFRVQALGFSMYPFIKNRDTITISPLVSGRPWLGDIVAFIQPGTGKLTVHRVVGFLEDRCLIRGDNMSELDGAIPRANIQGYVIRVERDGKEIWWGSGPEKYLIALMSQRGLLYTALVLAYRLVGPVIKRIKA